jgi:hypothetical protein
MASGGLFEEMLEEPHHPQTADQAEPAGLFQLINKLEFLVDHLIAG